VDMYIGRKLRRPSEPPFYRSHEERSDRDLHDLHDLHGIFHPGSSWCHFSILVLK
jgi:hypothetical protein